MNKQPLIRAVSFLAAAVVLCTSALAAGDEIKVRYVEISTPTATVRVNQTRTLFAWVRPVDADDDTITWESSNEEVVTINGDGVLTGISPGTATVTARGANNRSATCEVTVPGTAVSYLTEDVSNADQPGLESSGGEVLSAAALRSDVEQAVKAAANNKATVTYRDKTRVSRTALRGAAYIADYHGGAATIKAVTPAGEAATDVWGNPDTTGDQGWLAIDPAQAGDGDGSIYLGVYTDADHTAALQKKAATALGREARVVQLAHTGAYGMTVTVAARLELSGINYQSATLYHYNSATGVFTPFANQARKLDGNGYLRFSTDRGGVIVVA